MGYRDELAAAQARIRPLEADIEQAKTMLGELERARKEIESLRREAWPRPATSGARANLAERIRALDDRRFWTLILCSGVSLGMIWAMPVAVKEGHLLWALPMSIPFAAGSVVTMLGVLMIVEAKGASREESEQVTTRRMGWFFDGIG